MQGSVCSSPPVVTHFDTVCASDFVGKDNSAPKIKIDLIYSPVGKKTATHRVKGLPDILGSEVAQPGQNPGSQSQGSTAVTKPAARDGQQHRPLFLSSPFCLSPSCLEQGKDGPLLGHSLRPGVPGDTDSSNRAATFPANVSSELGLEGGLSGALLLAPQMHPGKEFRML